MSYLLQITHNHLIESYDNLDTFIGRDVTLVASGSVQQINVHKLILLALSDFLKTIFVDIPISELNTILLPDISEDTLQLLLMVFYNGTLQCTRTQYQDLMELMELLCVDTSNAFLCDFDGNSVQFNDYDDSSHLCDSFDDFDQNDTISYVKEEAIDNSISFDSASDTQEPEHLKGVSNVQSNFVLKVKKEDNVDAVGMNSLNTSDPTLEDGYLDILYSCSKCDKSFSSAAYLEAHMVNHGTGAGERKFHCRFCQFATSNQKDCSRHNRETHPDKFNFKCNFCQQTFINKQHLAGHVSDVHTPKAIKCSMCDYTCGRKRALSRHISSVHNKEKPHACHFCGKCYTQSHSLSHHLKVVHSKN